MAEYRRQQRSRKWDRDNARITTVVALVLALALAVAFSMHY